MVDSNKDLWDDIPSHFYIALGRRGQEAISLDQCFLEGCDNQKIEELEPLGKETFSSEKKEDGSYYDCTKIQIRCKKCGGTFQIAMKTMNLAQKNAEGGSVVKPFMGMGYILDQEGKNLGFLGYY
jgi:hypothetical protein